MATRTDAGSPEAYLRSLRAGERFYASWVLDWLRAGQPSSVHALETNLPSPPAYPAQWSEARAKQIAGEVFRRWRHQQGEAAEAETLARFQRQRQLAEEVASGARHDVAVRRLEASLRYGRGRRKRLLGRVGDRAARRRGLR